MKLVCDIGVWREIFEALKQVGFMEYEFEFRKDKVIGMEFDASRVLCVVTEIDVDLFDKYELEVEPRRARFDVMWTCKVLKTFPKKEKYIITINNQFKAVSLTGRRRLISFSLLLPSNLEMFNPDEALEEQKAIKINSKVMVDELIDGVKQGMLFGDNVKLMMSDNEVLVAGTSEKGTSLMSFIKTVSKMKEFESTFKADLLLNVLKACRKVSRDAVVGIGNNSPIRVIVTKEKLKMKFYLAPVIEG